MNPGKLYFGDNLQVLRESFRSESVDLVYLDPPFNSNRDHNVLYREQDLSPSRAQIRAFEDSWHWDHGTQATYEELTGPDAPEKGVPPALSILMEALYRSMPKRNDVIAYLVMMAPRLIELRRVLRDAGALYLHCDSNVSHYLKLVLDSIFGAENFRNEVIWKRSSAHNSAKRYGPVHDTLLFYSKGKRFTWNQSYQPYDQKYLDEFYTHFDKDGRRWRRSDVTAPGAIRNGQTGKAWRGIDVTAKGRHWFVAPSELDLLDKKGKIHWPAKKGGMPMLKRYADEQPGVPLQDVWTDLPPLHNLAAERLGYPTQKPVALLERVVSASSNPGDVILDPFCGCGTTIEAAQKLGREWIGIDITHLAIKVVRDRMASKYPGVEYELLGEPQDVESARVLAEVSPYEFQWWAVHRVKGRPVGGDHGGREGKKGADRGVDGFIKFRTASGVQEVVISVKGGRNVGPAMVRELRGTVERQRAAIGVLLTLQEPTAEMKREAIEAGFFRTKHDKFPKLQLLSVQDLFDGKSILYPSSEQIDAATSEPGQALLPGMEHPPPPPRKGVRIKVPETPATTTPLALKQRAVNAVADRKKAKAKEG